MNRIRCDLLGVVVAHDGATAVWLHAGDEVPDTVAVDDSLLESASAAVEDTDSGEAEKPKRSRTRKKAVDASDTE